MSRTTPSKASDRPTPRPRPITRPAPDSQSAFIDPWANRCAEFAAQEGFRHFVFGLRLTRAEGRSVQFALTNYPREWLQLYDNNSYLRIDPVAALLLTSIKPFAWDEIQEGGTKDKVFWRQAARFGLQYGYTVPVHGPRGQHAVIGLGGIEQPLSATAKKLVFEHSWSFTVELLDEIFGTYLQHDGEPSATPLSAKQRDALSLISQGWSIRDIGTKLGLHPRTVEYHLAGAMRKLGAATREQAIVRALLGGDIEDLKYPGELRDWCLRIQSG
jgi:LuxR family transcriptional activator of bioluminescence operon